MKKIAIAGASLALAAMPVVGVFAADGNTTTTDTVQVTIDSACSLTATGTGSYSTTLTNGTASSDLGSTSINIKCNDAGGWMVNAIGANTSTTASAGATDMAPDVAGKTPIATGTNFDGSVSNWAMKLTAGEGTYAPSIVTGYDDYHAVPSVANTKVASGVTTDQTTGSTFTTSYKVAVSPTQQTGTYTGKVTYTLVHPNA